MQTDLIRGDKPASQDPVMKMFNQLSCQGNLERRWQETEQGAWCKYSRNTHHSRWKHPWSTE